MSRKKPSRKKRRRERRAAARHGLTVEKYRTRNGRDPDAAHRADGKVSR